MTPELGRVFEALILRAEEYFAFREDALQEPLAQLARNLSEWRRSYPDALRPDAAYFLLVNAEALIAAPLTDAGAPVDEVSTALRDDLSLILSFVQEQGAEVSARRLLHILAENWGNLSLTASDWWD